MFFEKPENHMTTEVQDRLYHSCLALIGRKAWQKPGTLIEMGSAGEYLLYPTTGQGAYFIFRNEDDNLWYWAEIEGRESLQGPFKTRALAVENVTTIDLRIWNEKYPSFPR